MFDQMNLPVGVTVTDFERAMSEIEPGIEGESLQAGVILLVAASRAEIGQDVDALAAFTGYDRDLERPAIGMSLGVSLQGTGTGLDDHGLVNGP